MDTSVMPRELWESIILLLEDQDIAALTLVSKELRSHTMSASFRCRYLITRYGHAESIYQAALRPKSFTPELLRVSVGLDFIIIEESN